MVRKIFITLLLILSLSTIRVDSLGSIELSKYQILKLLVDDDLYEIVYSIIEVESNWNENAVSPTHDYGLMQINKPTWENNFDWDMIFDANYNITAGVKILKLCLDASNNDLHKALIMYNGSKSYPYKIYHTRKRIFGRNDA